MNVPSGTVRTRRTFGLNVTVSVSRQPRGVADRAAPSTAHLPRALRRCRHDHLRGRRDRRTGRRVRRCLRRAAACRRRHRRVGIDWRRHGRCPEAAWSAPAQPSEAQCQAAASVRSRRIDHRRRRWRRKLGTGDALAAAQAACGTPSGAAAGAARVRAAAFLNRTGRSDRRLRSCWAGSSFAQARSGRGPLKPTFCCVPMRSVRISAVDRARTMCGVSSMTMSVWLTVPTWTRRAIGAREHVSRRESRQRLAPIVLSSPASRLTHLLADAICFDLCDLNDGVCRQHDRRTEVLLDGEVENDFTRTSPAVSSRCSRRPGGS